MRRLALLFSLPALVAGCSDGGDRAHLAQTSWRFERIDGQAPASTGAELTFDNARIGVQMGCNRLGGPWRINEKRLVAGPFAQTQTACATPDWNEERAVGALLVATPRMNIDGNRMTLQSSGHTAELVRIEDEANARLGG